MLASYGFAVLISETSYMIAEHVLRVDLLVSHERLIQKAIEIGVIVVARCV